MFKIMSFNVSQFDCIYCGMKAKARDHVIPFSYHNYTESRDSDDYSLDEVVPACGECNSLLSNHMITTIAARADYISNILSTRYKKVLSAPDWTLEELDALGKTLRAKVRKLQLKKKVVQLRIEHAKECAKLVHLTPRAYWDEFITKSSSGTPGVSCVVSTTAEEVVG